MKIVNWTKKLSTELRNRQTGGNFKKFKTNVCRKFHIEKGWKSPAIKGIEKSKYVEMWKSEQQERNRLVKKKDRYSVWKSYDRWILQGFSDRKSLMQLIWIDNIINKMSLVLTKTKSETKMPIEFNASSRPFSCLYLHFHDFWSGHCQGQN